MINLLKNREFNCYVCGESNEYYVRDTGGIYNVEARCRVPDLIVFTGSNQGIVNLECKRCHNKNQVIVNL